MGKYAVLVTAGPERPGSALNGLEYALRLADSDHEVEVYLDGAATTWPDEIETKVEHPLHESLSESLDRELVAGACAFCAAAFGGTRGCEGAGIPLVGTAGEEHGPDVGALVDEGFELVTVT